ncbi:AAA family ATPase [Alteromonas sp. MYP5]|uniref:AAA family ATPase n=1 Tax=Alteromonas ponticola TaxID=2720613 RepID=A0ABX1R5C0_9ALTE|nr:AAA family ATPase [Alteromonas ponticola]
MIKNFTIKKLYGERDVSIDFSENIKVLVAENGYGKTTVLNALFGILSGDIHKLRDIEFDKICVEFSDDEKFEIKSSEFSISYDSFTKNGIYDYLKRKVGEPKTLRLIEHYLTSPNKVFLRSSILNSVSKRAEMPGRHIHSMLSDMSNVEGEGFKDLVEGKEKLKRIREKFGLNIVYLPTYRRVEQDFEELSANESVDISNEHSINFGMKDVSQRFEEITEEIKSSSVQWFSKVNGEMLSQLVEGFKVDDETKNNIDAEALKIVLDRIGNNIQQSYKKEIIRLVDSGEIFSGHDPLVYFISNLVKVYGEQKSNDKAIQEFSEVCNRYLVDKKIDYNESDVTIDIVRRKNGKSVDIENLSSGEKQIISLFARLYLKREDNLAIFFDEPELSLSIEWQKTLLPDILNSGKCSFLFTTTHSPFIFENELAQYTVDLGHYIKEL